MSIASAMAAEIGEQKRKEWLADLREAQEKEDWKLVEALIGRMTHYYFSE